MSNENPFSLTRASDLKDQQIAEFWVDPESLLFNRLRPQSQLPMFILGGKGSGKTHIMRYLSYAIQRIVFTEKDSVREYGYLGVYLRASGLNGNRFKGKGFTDEEWEKVFVYHSELWLGRELCNTISTYLEDIGQIDLLDNRVLMDNIIKLLDYDDVSIEKFDDLVDHLENRRRDLDLKINNMSFSRELKLNIDLTVGFLFRLANVVSACIPCLKNTQFTILIDEYENLTEMQQRHFNTLVREREGSVSFKIGARLYGVKTWRTNSAQEELKLDSEYERINLDEMLRKDSSKYRDFARSLTLDKISKAFDKPVKDISLDDIFPVIKGSEFNTDRRPWLDSLRNDLGKYSLRIDSLNVTSPQRINEIIENIAHHDALIEKTNCFLLYRAWSKNSDLLQLSIEIKESAVIYSADFSKPSLHHTALDKFRSDLVDQMKRDLNIPLLNSGVDKWIDMSNGIIRNYLTILKNIFDGANDCGESDLLNVGISERAQTMGVEDSCQWFLDDATVLGDSEGIVKQSLSSICHLLEQLRFSKKPSECSLSTFSVDLSTMIPSARDCIDQAYKWSLLIPQNSRYDRNSSIKIAQFRVNGMVAPIYNLPLYTRGQITLTSEESNVIFSGVADKDYLNLVKKRVKRCNPPFELSKQPKKSEDELF